jgi:hypothetical protein
MKVYGPYTRKDKRQHVVIVENGKSRTVSYPKWIMEQHLGRKLSTDETVDHIDENVQNESIDNYQILSRADNVRKSVKRAEYLTLTCKYCGKQFQRRRAVDTRNQTVRRVDGPFCSRQCVGKVHH